MCPNLLINFLASSTLLHTALSFPNCKTNFFILNPLGRVAIGLNRLVDFNLAIEVAVFSNRKRQLNVVNSDFVV